MQFCTLILVQTCGACPGSSAATGQTPPVQAGYTPQPRLTGSGHPAPTGIHPGVRPPIPRPPTPNKRQPRSRGDTPLPCPQTGPQARTAPRRRGYTVETTLDAADVSARGGTPGHVVGSIPTGASPRSDGEPREQVPNNPKPGNSGGPGLKTRHPIQEQSACYMLIGRPPQGLRQT